MLRRAAQLRRRREARTSPRAPMPSHIAVVDPLCVGTEQPQPRLASSRSIMQRRLQTSPPSAKIGAWYASMGGPASGTGPVSGIPASGRGGGSLHAPRVHISPEGQTVPRHASVQPVAVQTKPVSQLMPTHPDATQRPSGVHASPAPQATAGHLSSQAPRSQTEQSSQVRPSQRSRQRPSRQSCPDGQVMPAQGPPQTPAMQRSPSGHVMLEHPVGTQRPEGISHSKPVSQALSKQGSMQRPVTQRAPAAQMGVAAVSSSTVPSQSLSRPSQRSGLEATTGRQTVPVPRH